MFHNRPTVDQLNIPAVPTVGELVLLADVGGNPGLPAMDGSNLTNVVASVNTDSILTSKNTGTSLVSDNSGNILVSG